MNGGGSSYIMWDFFSPHLMDYTNLVLRNAHCSIQSKPLLRAESMQTRDRFGASTSITETCWRRPTFVFVLSEMEAILSCCFVYFYPNCGACMLSINPEPLLLMRRGCRLSSSLKAFAPSVWSCLSSALRGKPQQDLKVFACHSVFFVHNVWQVVAWDTCSKIHLEGLVVYERHPLLWQSALCRLLFVICFKLIRVAASRLTRQREASHSALFILRVFPSLHLHLVTSPRCPLPTPIMHL